MARPQLLSSSNLPFCFQVRRREKREVSPSLLRTEVTKRGRTSGAEMVDLEAEADRPRPFLPVPKTKKKKGRKGKGIFRTKAKGLAGEESKGREPPSHKKNRPFK